MTMMTTMTIIPYRLSVSLQHSYSISTLESFNTDDENPDLQPSSVCFNLLFLATGTYTPDGS